MTQPNGGQRRASNASGSGAGARLTRVAVYYALLLGGAFALSRSLLSSAPASIRDAVDRLTGGEGLTGGAFSLQPLVDAAAPAAPEGLALTAVLAMLAALSLALPVAWVYTSTRARRGYRQSVVHSLILLPVVVAGVVVLVKHSLALAFSLAGIVAAVRFRNTLEDSKDAVYIFLVTGIGLAAGVDIAVAAALSVIFNGVILFLWYSDLGRSTRLEGRPAEARLQRALAAAGRTGTFVARLDAEVLREMSPEQLEALAERAERRRRRYAPERTDERRVDAVIRIRTGDASAVRDDVETVLDQFARRWRYGGTLHEEDGVQVLEYTVQLRKGQRREALNGALLERCGARTTSVEVL
jgi:hypothetical protein